MISPITPSKDILKFLTVKNKQAEKDFYRGIISMYTYNKIKNIEFYEEDDTGNWFLPLTVFDFNDTLEEKKIDIDMSIDPKPLYESQKEVVKMTNNIKDNSIIISCHTGFGKTRIMIEFIRTYKLRTLVLVPNCELLKQTVNKFKEYNLNVSIYGNGKKDLTGDIVIMTMQGLIRFQKEDILQFPFTMLLIDECHKFLGEKIKKSLLYLPCKRCFGFSATPYTSQLERNDVEKVLGQCVEFGKLAIKPEVFFYKYDKKEEINFEKYTIERMIKIDRDNNRLTEQIKIIYDLYVNKKRKNILVLYDRISHSNIVHKILSKYFKNSYKLTGEMSDEERIINLNEYKEKGGILVASDAIAGVGFDVPHIDTVCLFFPNKFDGRIIQMVGRALRPCDGKENVWIIDWIDSSLVFQWYKRKKVYKTEYENIPKDYTLISKK